MAALSVAPARFTVKVTVPANTSSATTTLVEFQVNTVSSSRILTVLVGVPPSALSPVGELKVTVNVSSLSTTASLAILMAMVLLVSPAANARVPLTAV